MAGLEGLASMIYHEKQQPGSMLCAQHALNSLLQGEYFTAPDLSSIAQNLDSLEDSYRDEGAAESRNMDDTGFFSVQVLEQALSVWGLNLVRWRSEEMRPYNDRPHTQLAFILNLEQHWFTLRRFGPAVPKLEEDPGEGHWFNLNSFLSAPEWVGKLYLGMVLQQAETEGYSVFAVTQADPGQPLALPRTEADEVAATLPEPTSASASTNRNAFQRSSEPSASSSGPKESSDMENFEDEDLELQAALQASLMRGDDEDMGLDDASTPPPITSRFTVPLPPSSGMHSPAIPTLGSIPQTPQRAGSGSLEQEELDPVAASMARNRHLLEQMQRQQAYAAREMWSEEDLTPEEAEALRQRREERRRQEEEEEEHIRLAIEESERMAREYQAQQSSSNSKEKAATDSDEEIDEDMDPRAQSASTFTPITAYFSGDRVYDDDDAELQAALKASLEGLPSDFQHPVLPPPAQPTHTSSSQVTPPAPAPVAAQDKDDTASIASTDTAESEAVVPEPVEELSLEEIRRRRLARFGGA